MKHNIMVFNDFLKECRMYLDMKYGWLQNQKLLSFDYCPVIICQKALDLHF